MKSNSNIQQPYVIVGIDQFNKALKSGNLGVIESLELCGLAKNKSILTELIPRLSQMTNLQSLNFFFLGIGEEDMKAIIKVLRSLTNLKDLDLFKFYALRGPIELLPDRIKKVPDELRKLDHLCKVSDGLIKASQYKLYMDITEDLMEEYTGFSGDCKFIEHTDHCN
jgi:hypothetical protein